VVESNFLNVPDYRCPYCGAANDTFGSRYCIGAASCADFFFPAASAPALRVKCEAAPPPGPAYSGRHVLTARRPHRQGRTVAAARSSRSVTACCNRLQHRQRRSGLAAACIMAPPRTPPPTPPSPTA
jgi:hypothetical protein